MNRGGRQFSRGNGGGGVGPGGGGGSGIGAPYRQRRFRGQYTRTRSPPDHDDVGANMPSYQQPQQQQQSSNNQHQNYNDRQAMRGQQSQHQQHRNSHQQLDVEDIKDICSKLDDIQSNQIKFINELNHLKGLINELAGTLERSLGPAATATTNKKSKPLKKREQDQAGGDVDAVNSNAAARKNKERNIDRLRRNQKRDNNSGDKENKALPSRLPNDDSTTQAADPSSEDKLEGDEGGERVKKVYRRRRQQFGRRGDRRRRMDSSERNSNDTSPQNDEYRRPKPRQKKNFPELSEAEMNEVVQAVKRDFLASEIISVKKAMHEKGPVVAKEFAYAILDYAIQDVTSLTKLGDIATNLAQVLVGDEGGHEFQMGFSSALNDLSKRGEEIVIDAPRYMDTLGQVLGQCLVNMNKTGRGRRLIKRFLVKSLHSFVQQNRATLLASTMRGIADSEDERFAKEIWDLAGLKWSNFLSETTNLDEFLAQEKVEFTTKEFSPQPPRAKSIGVRSEKFGDDVTDLVEKQCSVQTLENLVSDLGLDTDEQKTEYLGTLVYAIVRGCLVTDSGESRLDTEALSKYSSIMKSQQQNKKELADAIALKALTALTKLWHTLNCPQNLMSNILLALHNNGAASYDSLQTWLNSDDLKNIPGMGVARLNSKRCIEDLGAMRS